FYVKKGNPKKIAKWEDIAKDGVRLINRERGAGTRVLLDEKMKKLGINVNNIKGYDNEETSHLSIASAVARGDADVGIGTEKVALQVGAVDFIPMQKERYDLIIKKETLEDEKYERIIEIIKSNQFKKEVEGLGGYDTKDTGKIMAIT
ncbi:MAG: substrate-binding domain-containing protein, partial [Clostridium sp.]